MEADGHEEGGRSAQEIRAAQLGTGVREQGVRLSLQEGPPSHCLPSWGVCWETEGHHSH